MRLTRSVFRLPFPASAFEISPRATAVAAFVLAGFFGLTVVALAHVWFGVLPSRGQRSLWTGLTGAVSVVPFFFLVRPMWHSVFACPRAALAVGLVAGLGWTVSVWAGPGAKPRSLVAPMTVVQSLAVVVLAALAYAGMAALLRALWRFTDGRPEVPVVPPAGSWRSAILATVAFLIAANGLVGVYRAGSVFIPYWDYGSYWTITGDLARLAVERPGELLPFVRTSVACDDYNVLPALIPAFVATLARESWPVYLHTIATAYGGAVALALFGAIRRTAGGPATPWSAAWPVALILTTPMLWAPTLRGYADLGAVALALGALGLSLRAPARALSVRGAVALGVLLVGTVLYRRWMSIWVVGFVVVAAVEAAGVAALAMWRRRRLVAAVVEGRVLLVAGTVAAAILLAVASPLLARILATNYAASYEAYRLEGSFAARTATNFSAMGWAYPVAFAAAAVVGFADVRLRRLTVYAVAVAAVAHIQFHRIQDMGPHHRLMYAPSYLLLLGAVGVRLLDSVRGPIRAFGFAGAVAASAFGLALTTVPALDGLRHRLTRLAPCETAHPLSHPNPDGVRALGEWAHREAEERGTTFTVVSSSLAFNQTHVLNAHRALGRPRPVPWRQEWYAEVDKVNGFPSSLFSCGVIVVAEPVQLHLPAREQVNVSAGTAALLGGTTVGAAFRRLPDPVEVAPGVLAWLYVRTRPFAPGEAEAFCDLLRAAHPDWPAATEPPGPMPDWPPGMLPRD